LLNGPRGLEPARSCPVALLCELFRGLERVRRAVDRVRLDVKARAVEEIRPEDSL
jgi:hypothetical protein